MDDEALACFPGVYNRSLSSTLRRACPLVRLAAPRTHPHPRSHRSPSLLPWDRPATLRHVQGSSRRIVSRKIGLCYVRGSRKSRNKKDPRRAPVYARACLQNGTAVTCGKCDTMRRPRKPGRIKGPRLYRGKTVPGVRTQPIPPP